MSQRYYLEGFRPPDGIQDVAGVRALQRELGVVVDGIWGPKTEAAYCERNSVTDSTLQIPTAKAGGAAAGTRYSAGQAYIQDSTQIPDMRNVNGQLPKAGVSSSLSKISNVLVPGKAVAKPEARTELQRLINTSSFLDDKEKWRANYTIDALDQDTLVGLLKDVERDGADTYFSREAWETRAMLMAGPRTPYVGQNTANEGASFVKSSYENGRQKKALPGEDALQDYFTEEEIKTRTQKENAVMEAFRSLYAELKNNGKTEEDLGKILYHMMMYGDMANARKSGVFYQGVPYYDPEAYYCSPWEERGVTGRVIAEYLDYGEFKDEYGFSQHQREMLELTGPLLKGIDLISLAVDIGYSIDHPMNYFKSTPEHILKTGDVRITFQPTTAEYFKVYYYRGEELLFSKIIDLPNSHIEKYGVNFEKYAKEFPQPSPSDIPWMIFDYLMSIIVPGPLDKFLAQEYAKYFNSYEQKDIV